MTAQPAPEATAVFEGAYAPPGDLARRLAPLKRFFRDPKAVIGALLIAGFIVLAVAAPLIAPYGENELNPALGVETPSWSHPLGTDRVGRDTLSRVIFGTRTSVSVGLIAVGVACAI